jgi:hypothetical protein
MGPYILPVLAGLVIGFTLPNAFIFIAFSTLVGAAFAVSGMPLYGLLAMVLAGIGCLAGAGARYAVQGEQTRVRFPISLRTWGLGKQQKF